MSNVGEIDCFVDDKIFQKIQVDVVISKTSAASIIISTYNPETGGIRRNLKLNRDQAMVLSDLLFEAANKMSQI